MKKIMLALCVSTLIGASVLIAQVYTGGWNYVYAAKTGQCIKVNSDGLTIGRLLNDGCTLCNVKERHGTVYVLDCRDHPSINGYVWYARTLKACQWIKRKGVR